MPLRTACLWWIRIAEDNLLAARRSSGFFPFNKVRCCTEMGMAMPAPVLPTNSVRASLLATAPKTSLGDF
ncbi:hypothetical protein ZWY2020_048131 [Hordeum vulgare]|nr:hypothetical protein ZWY2020_048131 [Hordeum vulgare]